MLGETSNLTQGGALWKDYTQDRIFMATAIFLESLMAGQESFKKKLPNELALIRQTLGPFRGELVGIAVESTYNWYWLVDGLMEEGYRVHLANPSAIQKYSG